MNPEDVSDSEIHAYMDDELDLGRRLAVEHHLARNPAAAARLMADLELRTALRMIDSAEADPPAGMRQLAARLAPRLRKEAGGRFSSPSRPLIRMAAAAALLAIIMVPGRDVLASPPELIGEAVEAYHAGLLRAAMASQVETPRIDAQEVQRSARIRIPRLPEKWVVTDAQIFPTDEGPALQLMVNTPDDETMSILAVRAATTAPEAPTAVRHAGASVAYWRDGEMVYALTGEATPEAVDLAAEDIASNG